MNIDRDSLLLQIRPNADVQPIMDREIEIFQKKTIIPVMQIQGKLLIFGFKTFLKKTSSDFTSLSSAHQRTYINDRLRSDAALKNSLINYVVALFVTEELKFYTKNRLEIRKRIIDLSISMLEQHLQDLV